MSTVHIMALRHSAFYSPLLMTMAGGFLRDEGLEYTYTVATPQQTVAASLADGSAHVAQSAVATGFAGLERGEHSDIVHFAQINSRDGFFIAGRFPEPGFTWDRLRGKRVLVDHLFQPLAMLRYALHRHGIELSELTVIDAGNVDEIDRAFRRGEGDYVHQQGPAPQQLEHDGIGYVVASVGAEIGPIAFSSLCATRAWLDTNMASAFTRAYRRAREFVQIADASELAARLAAAGFFPGIDPAVLVATLTAYRSLGCWSGDAAIEPESYERLLDIFEFNRLITRRYPYAALIVSTSQRQDTMTLDRKQHWETVYAGKSPQQVSWYQSQPGVSLELIAATGSAYDAAIIDVGGGASTLVDHLLVRGYGDVTVLDLSAHALTHAQARLGSDAARVRWIEADVTTFTPSRRYAVWHDRAVFHFLTDAGDRRKYITNLKRAIPVGAHVIIAAFAVGGPTRCSGLDIVQYDADKLARELGPEFRLDEQRAEAHATPSGKTQQFGYFRWTRIE